MSGKQEMVRAPQIAVAKNRGVERDILAIALSFQGIKAAFC